MFLVFDLVRVVHHVCFALAKLNILKSYAIGSGSLGSFEDLHAKRLAGRHNGPYDPCELGGQSDGDQSRGFARQKSDQPIS